MGTRLSRHDVVGPYRHGVGVGVANPPVFCGRGGRCIPMMSSVLKIGNSPKVITDTSLKLSMSGQ